MNRQEARAKAEALVARMTLEEKLGLLGRFQKMEQGLRACQAELSQVRATEESAGHLAEARRWIDELLNQEEA